MRGPVRDQRERLDIEVLGDGVGVDVREVSFGRGSSPQRRPANDERPQSPWRAPALVGTAIGLLVGAVVWGAGRSSPSVSSGATAAVTTTTAAPVATIAPPPIDEPTTTTRGPLVAELTGGSPIVPNLPGPATLYLVDSSGSTLITVDLQTGRFVEGERRDGRVAGMMRTAGGPVPLVVSWSAASPVALGPAGTFWVQDQNTQAGIIQMDAVTGAELVTLSDPFGSDAMFGAYLLGSLPNGDPVVYGPDSGTFALHADGSPPTRVTRGPAFFDYSGAFVENVCDDNAVCAQRLHPPNGATADVPMTPVYMWSFAPNSRWAISSNGDELWLTDIRTAEQRELALPGRLLVDDFGQMLPSTWTPDGDRLLLIDRNQLIVLDAPAGEAIAAIELPSDLGPYRAVGVL